MALTTDEDELTNAFDVAGVEAKSALQKLLNRSGASPQQQRWIVRLVVVLALVLSVSLLFSVFVSGPSLPPSAPIKLQRIEDSPRTGPVLMSADVYNYTDADAPYWHESVKHYRTRISNMNVRPNTIFVSIASFRDNVCQDTLVNILTKAKDPSRVVLGVVDQFRFFDPEDIPCDTKLSKLQRRQVRLVRVPAANGRGPTHARYIASKLWDGEEFFVQIDGHSDFLQDWDEHLLHNLRVLPRKSIITHYPTSDAVGLGITEDTPWICETTLTNAPVGLVIQLPGSCSEAQRSDGIALDENGRKTTCFSPFIGAGFLAGHSSMLLDAPYDKHLKFLFHGEELLMAARLFTSGWDLFTPTRNLISHMYGSRDKNVFVEVPTWSADAKLSESRARLLLQIPQPGDEVADFDRAEMEDLGLGHERSVSEYFEYAGLNFKTNHHTSRCRSRFDPASRRWIETSSPDRLNSL